MDRTILAKNFGGLGGSPPKICLRLDAISSATAASSKIWIARLSSPTYPLSIGVSQFTFRYKEKVFSAEIVHISFREIAKYLRDLLLVQ